MVSGTTFGAAIGLLGLALIAVYLAKLQYTWLSEIIDEYGTIIQN
jgi:hypothetical protein